MYCNSIIVNLLLAASLGHGFILGRHQTQVPLRGGQHDLSSFSTFAQKDSSLHGSEKNEESGGDDFWKQQLQLARELTTGADAGLRAEQNNKFKERRLALVGETAYIGFFIFCICWTLADNPFVAFSYALGASTGVAYAYGLGEL
jgi:hypothetical protein